MPCTPNSMQTLQTLKFIAAHNVKAHESSSLRRQKRHYDQVAVQPAAAAQEKWGPA